jgi:hypothetical protein
MNTPQNTYWNTRDGRKILIADMEIGHVLNCAKMMQIKYGIRCRDKEDWREWLCRLITEAQLQKTLSALLDPNGQ